MASLDDAMQRSIGAMGAAQTLTNVAIEEYYAACERYDWATAEAKRAEALAHAEAYLDHVAAAFKRLEVDDPKVKARGQQER